MTPLWNPGKPRQDGFGGSSWDCCTGVPGATGVIVLKCLVQLVTLPGYSDRHSGVVGGHQWLNCRGIQVGLTLCLWSSASSWVGGFAQGFIWLHFVGLQGQPNHVQCYPSPALPLAPCPNCAHFKAALLQPAVITGDAQMPCAGGAPMLAIPTALSLSLVLAEHHWAGAQGNIWLAGECQRCLGHQSHPLPQH